MAKKKGKFSIEDRIENARQDGVGVISKVEKLVDDLERATNNKEIFEISNQLRSINRGVLTVTYNKDKMTLFVATELTKVKELVYNVSKLDGILETYNRVAAQIAKEGKYSEYSTRMKEAADFMDEVNKHLDAFNALISEKLRNGIGSRRDIFFQNEADKEAQKEKIKNMVREGVLPSQIRIELDAPEDRVRSIFNSLKNEYMEANQAAIIKLITAKTPLGWDKIAEQFEIKESDLEKYINIWAKDDEKLENIVDKQITKKAEEAAKAKTKSKETKKEEQSEKNSESKDASTANKTT